MTTVDPTVTEFLTTLLRPAPKGSMACLAAFKHAASPDWTGQFVRPDRARLNGSTNNYFSTAAFPPGATKRRIDQMVGVCAIVIDDPTTKGDTREIAERLGPPSYRTSTSEGNEQWGYFLDELASADEISPVLQKIKELGLGDASGNSAVRYARLPCGINDKYDEPYHVRPVKWDAERRFSLRKISKALGVGKAVARRDAVQSGESDGELRRLIRSGESFHDPLMKLAYRAMMRGERKDDAIFELQSLMRKSKERDTPRWRERYAQIERSVLEVLEKFPEAAVKQRLRREGKGFVADEENVWRILEGDESLQGLVRYDAFMCQRIATRPVPGDTRVVADREYPRPWRDEDTVSVQRYVQDRYIVKVGREKVLAVIHEWSMNRWPFHPIRDYLSKLKWDGKTRIGGWLHTYLGATDAPHAYVRAIAAKWLIAAVARVMDPGCKVDTMLCLEGPQGARKSMALQALASPAYFSDSMPTDLSSKDARDHVRGKWIVEMSELAQFRKSEIETVKAFISRQVEQFRPAYGRSEITYPRQCVFAGSTNASEYLVDDTGNRRFWVVPCRNIDIDGLKRDRDQLWAEAADRYLLGETWWLEGDMERIAAEQTDARRLFDPWQDEIETMLNEGVFKERDRIRPSQILDHMDLTASQRTAIYAARAGKVLRALGWRKPSLGSKDFVRPKASK